jgi:NAD(P)-dependent dehydrogenase (short-subunit alcohol dehydrogenase family)
VTATEPALPGTVIPDEFAGRVVLVTAAAGAGIGQATARRFAAGGATVVVTDIHERRTAEVTAAIAADFPHVTVVGHPMDAGDRAAIDRVVDAVATDLGSIDVLVNNAAVNVLASHFDYDPDMWEWVSRVNLTGPWYLCRRILPLMRDSGRGGVVVNVSSYAPDVGGKGLESPYAITKGGLNVLTGGLNVLTRSVAHEGGAYGIRAVTVSMGVVRGTKFIDDHPEILAGPDAQGVLPWLPSAADIAESIAFLASDRARCITGEAINVSSGSYMRT